MDPIKRRARVSEEAAEWWVRLEADDMSRQERAHLVAWMCESPVHVAEILRIAQVHGALEKFRHWARVATEGASEDGNVVALQAADGADPRLPMAPKSRFMRGRRTLWSSAIAAGLCAIAIAAAWFVYDFGAQTIQTQRGERREVALADGSVLQVGPETRLRVKFEKSERLVVLDRGLALFRVVKDPRRPFVVHADRTAVRAVGTAFGIERSDRDVVVTVAEGTVAVSPVAMSTATLNAREAPETVPEKEKPIPQPSQTLMLVAGEQIAVARTGNFGAVRRVDSGRELAWAQGRLVFENDAVAEVVREFNRYNRVQLQVTDDSLARRPISGIFDASDPESFIAFVASVAPVHVIRGDGPIITLSPAQEAAAEVTKP